MSAVEDKITVPELSEGSQLSKGYLLALGSVLNYLEAVEEREPSRVRYMAKRSFLHREVPYYDSYFNDNKYMDVITLENQEAILKINHIVDKMNEHRVSGEADYDFLRNQVDEIVTLIN